MNLKGFKKVHDDEDEAVLTNHHGHSITIAKSALTKKHLDDLNGLKLHAAEGEVVPEKPAIDKENPSFSDYFNYLTGNTPEANAIHQAALQKWSGQSQQSQQSPGAFPATDDNSSQDIGNASLAPQQAPQPDPAQRTVQATPQPDPADSAQVDQPALAVQDTAAPVAKPQNLTEGIAQNLNKETSNYAQDLTNGHITPETYKSLFANKSTVGKIGTLFGLLVSGAGSGLSHQPNALMDMMNKEIDRDMEAQKANKGNALHFYQLNQQNEMNKANISRLKKEGNLTDAQVKNMAATTGILADTHAKNQMQLSLMHNIEQGINRLPPSQYKAQSQSALGGLQGAASTEIGQRNAQTAQAIEQQFKQEQNSLMLGDMAGVPGAGELAKFKSNRHVGEFPDQEANHDLSGDDRNKLTSGVEFDDKLNRFINWTKGHSGSINPKDIEAGKTKAAELQGAYRQATHGGVYKEGEQNFIGKLIDENPTKFFNSIRVLPKLEALQQEHRSRMAVEAKSMGLDYKPKLSEASPDSSSSQQPGRKFYQGKWYEKGPDGRAVEVK